MIQYKQPLDTDKTNTNNNSKKDDSETKNTDLCVWTPLKSLTNAINQQVEKKP